MKKSTSGNKISPEIEKGPFDRKGPRFALFLGSYFIAALLSGLTSVPWPPAIIWFPAGLITLLGYKPNSIAGWGYDLDAPAAIGTLLYLAILLPGVFAQSRRIFRVFYVIFVVLLIANIAGCTVLSRGS